MEQTTRRCEQRRKQKFKREFGKSWQNLQVTSNEKKLMKTLHTLEQYQQQPYSTRPSRLSSEHHLWHQKATKQKRKKRRKRKMGVEKCSPGQQQQQQQQPRNVIWSRTRCGPVIMLTALWATILLVGQQQGGLEGEYLYYLY